MTYFPAEGENYTENLFRFSDPLGEINQFSLPSASHFSDPDGLLIHTRQADFKTKDGEKVRYIGEIQLMLHKDCKKRNRQDQVAIEAARADGQSEEFIRNTPIETIRSMYSPYYKNTDYPEPTRQGLLTKLEQIKRMNADRSEQIQLRNPEPQPYQTMSFDARLIAPFMTENKFVDQAIRNSFFDAIKDDMPIVAFPADERAIGEVGGTDYPAQGAVDFYRKNVQNRLKKFLKQYDKDAKPEIIEIEIEEEGNFPVFGVRITPQLKKSIIEKGLPTYGIGATGVLGYGAAQEEKEKTGFIGDVNGNNNLY